MNPIMVTTGEIRFDTFLEKSVGKCGTAHVPGGGGSGAIQLQELAQKSRFK